MTEYFEELHTEGIKKVTDESDFTTDYTISDINFLSVAVIQTHTYSRCKLCNKSKYNKTVKTTITDNN